MELHTAMRILQVLAGLIFVGYIGKLFITPRAWKPRERSTDEYIADLERNGGYVIRNCTFDVNTRTGKPIAK